MCDVKYSIIVPVYNSANNLPGLLRSLLRQKYQRYEIVIVDDGSTDHIEELIDTQYKDKKIKYFKKEHGGPGLARKFGIEKCTGEFLCFLDSDDYVFPNYFEVLEKNIRDDVDILEYGYMHGANGKSYKPILNNRLTKTDRFMRSKRSTALWSCVYKKSLTKGIKHIDTSHSEDFYINFQMYQNAKNIISIEDVLYYYTYNESSLTRNAVYFMEMKENNIKVRKNMLQDLKLTRRERCFLKQDTVSYILASYMRTNDKNERKYLERQFDSFFSKELFKYFSCKQLIGVIVFMLNKTWFACLANVYIRMKGEVYGKETDIGHSSGL